MDISKEFDCKDCKAKYKQVKSLQRHIKRKHQGKIIDKSTENIHNVQKSLDIDHILKKYVYIKKKPEGEKIEKTTNNINNVQISLKHKGKIIDKSPNSINNVQKSLNIIKEFDCNYCNSSYKYEISLQKHMRKFHQDNVGPEILQILCNICGKKFAKEAYLMQHIGTIHNDIKFLYQCNICSKSYAKKHTLKNHQKKNHPDLYSKEQNHGGQKSKNDTDNAEMSFIQLFRIRSNEPETCTIISEEDKIHLVKPKLIKCEVCARKFKTNTNLRRHMKNIHSKEPPPLSRTIKCCVTNCNESFFNLQEFRIHLEDREEAGGHNCIIEKEEKVFHNMREFIQWKEDLEVAKDSRYISLRSTQKNKDGSYRRIYHCSRSGKYVGKGTGKRYAKYHGSSKMGVYCPSTMNVYYSKDGIVKCTYYKTHFGHEASWKRSIHIPIHKRDKLFIAEKRLQGVSNKKILEELHIKGGRSTYIKHQDILNVLKSDIFKNIKRCRNSRNLNVENKGIDKYEVSSQDGVTHNVTLKQIQKCICSRICLICGVCDHFYSCNCENYDKVNLCEHVHAVGAVNMEKSKQRNIDENSIEEKIQMQIENFIPDTNERESNIEEANTILIQMNSYLNKYSTENINETIEHIEIYRPEPTVEYIEGALLSGAEM